MKPINHGCRIFSLGILMGCILLSKTGLSNEPAYVYGNPGAAELAMESCPIDTTAPAVILYKECVITPLDNEIGYETKVRCRTKILKESGKSFLKLQMYEKRAGNVIQFRAITTNMENGKKVQYKLKRNELFNEESNDYIRTKKVAFKNLTVGSIVDYEYTLQELNNIAIKIYFFQDLIPVIYNKYTAKTYEFIRYTQNICSWYPIKSSVKNTSLRGMDCVDFEYIAENLPALKTEPLVWNFVDYLANVTINLKQINYSNYPVEKIAGTWSTFDQQLEENNFFGKVLETKGLFTKDVEKISKDTNVINHLNAILWMIRGKMKYNLKKTRSIDDLSIALRKKEGSYAEMNAALILALRDAGYLAYPILINSRNRFEKVNIATPTHYVFDSFIAGVETDRGTLVMDATMDGARVNVLRENSIVPYGRYMLPTGAVWIDLAQIVNTAITIHKLDLRFNEKGILESKTTIQRTGLDRLNFLPLVKEDMLKEHKENWERENKAVMIDYKRQGLETNDYLLEEHIQFEDPSISTGNNYLYINPIRFAIMDEQPLLAPIRKLPVEFPFPRSEIRISSLTIPEGYTVDELPKRTQLALNESGSIAFEYISMKSGNKIITRANFQMKDIQFSQTQYAELRKLLAKIRTATHQMIVLKKKAL